MADPLDDIVAGTQVAPTPSAPTPAPKQVSFDVAAALKVGYSEGDIASFLAKKTDFNYERAREIGYSDKQIINQLAPPGGPPKPPPPPPPEPVTDTGAGVVKQFVEDIASTPGSIVTKAGAITSAAGTGARGIEQVERDRMTRELGILDRVDAGETIKPRQVAGMGYRPDPDLIVANKYAGEDADGRVKMRADLTGKIAALPPIEETVGGRIGDTLEEAGSKISKVGHESMERVARDIGMTEEEKSRFSVKLMHAAATIAPYIGAAVLTGGGAALPAVMGVAGVNSFGTTYDEAIAKGADKQTAATAAFANSLIQGAAMGIPVSRAFEPVLGIVQKLSPVMQKQFMQTVAKAAESSATLLTFSEAARIADNVVAKNTYDPNRDLFKGVNSATVAKNIAAGRPAAEGVDLKDVAATAVVGAALGAVGSRASRPKVDPVKKILDAPDTDVAIAEARRMVEGEPVDTAAILEAATMMGDPAQQAQAKLNSAFQGHSDRDVIQAEDGTFHLREDGRQRGTGLGDEDTSATTPIKVWNPNEPRAEDAAPTISPELAARQRDVLEPLGIDVVHYEDDPSLPDGMVHLGVSRNTIFLSNNPQRNATQVFAHELTHILEDVKAPDGTRLVDVLHRQVKDNLTNQGWRDAARMFGETAPDRRSFPDTPEGIADHTDAIIRHLVTEMSADIGGEAPKFPSFIPKVIDAIEAKHGPEAARGVLRDLIESFRAAMVRLREMFVGAKGPEATVSQHQVENLGAIHDTLAKMWAEKFGTQAERENVALRDMRDRAQRDRFLTAEEAPPAPPEGFFDRTVPGATAETAAAPAGAAGPASITPAAQQPAVAEVTQRLSTLRRWLDELDAKRRQEAPASPQATFLRQTEAAILRKVSGVEDRLTGAQTERLAKTRQALADLENPTGDSPDMAKVRDAITREQQRLADAAAVGSPRAPMSSAERDAAPAGEPDIRGRAVMPGEAVPAGAPKPQPTPVRGRSPEAVGPRPVLARAEVAPEPPAVATAEAPHAETKRNVERDIGEAFFAGQKPSSAHITELLYRHSPALREARAATEAADEAARKARVTPESDFEPAVIALMKAHDDAQRNEAALLRAVRADVRGRRAEDAPAPAAVELPTLPSPVPAVERAAVASPGRRAPPAEMLTDAGEKIGGARKDRWAERGLRITDLEGMTEGEAFQHTTKDQVWPKPDYGKMVEDGMSPEAAAMVKIIRDRLAAKPRIDSQEGRRHYIEMMGHIRDVLSNVKTLFSPKMPTANPTRTYTPEQEAANKAIGAEIDVPTAAEWARNKSRGAGEKSIIQTLDRYYGIKADDPTGYMGLRLSNTAAGATEVFRTAGTLKFDGLTYDFKDRTGGVEALIKGLGPEAHDFARWVAGHRAEILKGEGRENLLDDRAIKGLKSLNQGTLAEPYALANGKETTSREAAYLDALKKYHELNKNVMDLVVESGLMKRATADEFLSNPFYIPFYRVDPVEGEQFVAPGTRSASVGQKAFEKLKGGTEKLNHDLWENADSNWSHLIEAALKNKNAIPVLKTAVQQGAAVKITAQEYAHLSDKQQKANTVWVMENGEKSYYRIENEGLMAAVSVLEPISNNAIVKTGKAFKQLLQTGVTMNPWFAVKNITRDVQQVLATTPISWNVAKNLYTGFSENNLGRALENVARSAAGQEVKPADMSDTALSAMAGGALMRMGDRTDTGIRQTPIDRILINTPDGARSFWEGIKAAASAYREAMAQSEDVSRIALFKQLKEQGLPHDFAAFSAKDIADFTLTGASPIVRTIIAMSAFTNPRAQGLYKVARSAFDADKSVAAAVGTKLGIGIGIRVAKVIAAGTLMGLALDAIYADDPDYKKRDEMDRNSNYWFKIGSTEFRIPKGFEVGALSSMTAMFVESFYDKEMTAGRVGKNVLRIVADNLNLDPTPTALKPVWDVAVNKSSATGSPIVGKGMERLDPTERYTNSNTLASRGVSKATFGLLSPVQIDYLTRAYAGWLGTTSMQIGDVVARSFSSEPVHPGRDLLSDLTGGIVGSEPRSSSRYVNMLYDQADGIEKAYATYRDMLNSGRPADAVQYYKDHQADIQKHGIVSSTLRTEAALNHQIRMIGNSPTLTAEQKKLQIMQLNAVKSRAAEQAVGVR